MSRGAGSYTYSLGAGRNAESECVIALNLQNVTCIPTVMIGGEMEKKIRQDLQEKADEMQAAKDRPAQT